MLILNLLNDPQQLIAFILALLLAITIHEFAHAWMANYLGDPTAKYQGRLTLNPLAHLDPIGTIFLLLAGFGWGKPVPINPNNLQDETIDGIKISLAGPFSNLLLATFLGLLIRFIPFSTAVFNFLVIIIVLNLILMVFNLLPIPPLDGSHILKLFIPAESYHLFQQLGLPILFILLIFSNYIPIIHIIISGTVSLFFNLVVGQPIEII